MSVKATMICPNKWFFAPSRLINASFPSRILILHSVNIVCFLNSGQRKLCSASGRDVQDVRTRQEQIFVHNLWPVKVLEELIKSSKASLFSYILLIHEGSHKEVYQGFQPSYDIFLRWSQGLFRPQVPCTPSLRCPMPNSASTQNQQSI